MDVDHLFGSVDSRGRGHSNECPPEHGSRFPAECAFEIPQPGSSQLDKVHIRVPKVDAGTSEGPPYLAFHDNAAGSDFAAPWAEVIGANAECEMRLPVAVMRRDYASGNRHGFDSGPAKKKDQNGIARYCHRAQTFIRNKDGKPEELAVKSLGPLEIIDVEASF
jgi:hypothetical protein